MEKNTKRNLGVGLLLCLLALALSAFALIPEQKGSRYYFDSEKGDNGNSGTKANRPWKSLDKLNEVDLQPGDQILLASGRTFSQPIVIRGKEGTASAPIKVSTYGKKKENAYAYIQTVGDLEALLIQNSSFIEVSNLSLSAGPGELKNQDNLPKNIMRCGVLIKGSAPGHYEHIYLENLEVKDVFYESAGFQRGKDEVRTANGTQAYGWGIRVISNMPKAFLKDIKINNVLVENVAHTGIKLTSAARKEKYGISDFEIANNKVFRTGGPGIQMSGVQNGHIHANEVDHSGSEDDSRKWGRGSGLWTWGSRNILIEKNRFTNANGPGDSAGAHIDFNCDDVVLQYNFSANNAGGFCEILGNNYNCAYRYNISVNDGHRVKGQKGAFQEGKVFWLSGYNGHKKPRKGPFNSYFYNNTIYVSDSIQAKVAIDRMAEGILIANNIFHIEGEAISVKGDQYRPERDGAIAITETFFENNLFLHAGSWPQGYHWHDSKPIMGNAAFQKPGGWMPEDYLPTAVQLIKDKGLFIKPLPGDSIGLRLGLLPSTDILGNPIIGKPDLGAIELR